MDDEGDKLISFTKQGFWAVLALALVGCKDPCKNAATVNSGKGFKVPVVNANCPPPPVVTYDVTPAEFVGKSYVGYQAWFNTPGDGTGRNWVHWGRTTPLRADQMTIDIWPWTAEYASGLYDSGFTLGNGQKAKLFSSYDPNVINTHMRWMKDYGIDGFFLQWFVLDDTSYRLAISNRIKTAAEIHQREFSIMIDYSGTKNHPFVQCSSGPEAVACIKNRWIVAVDAGLTQSPMYMKVNGRPLVSVWGFGFSHNDNLTAQDALNLIEWFHNSAPEKYRATILGGVTPLWRQMNNDANPNDPQLWQEVYSKLDIISPWAVARHRDDNSLTSFIQNVVKPDAELLHNRGQKYLPVIFPGFSWHNLYKEPLNDIPRRGGQFIWSQARALSQLGLKSFYTAMFDEVDEGTAIFKMAPTRADAPVEFPNLTLDADGQQLPSDWYLQVSGEISRALKSPNLEGFNSQQLPIAP